MPTSRFVVANGLRHHLLDWGGSERIVLLLHGFLEHAHAWDAVAPRLAAGGHRVCALDWRGHGDSEWVGAGGYYHFADYIADLAGIVRALGGCAAIVGHSMGGSAAALYAGTEPERVTRLVLVEGLGPPDMPPESAPDRFAAWIAGVARVVERGRVAPVRDDPAARLRERFPRFSADVAHHMASFGTRDEGETRVWKFDPLHQTRAPQPYSLAQARAFYRRIACPVLYVEGTESDFRLEPADARERLALLHARRTTIPGSGHHPHLETPDALTRVLLEFLG